MVEAQYEGTAPLEVTVPLVLLATAPRIAVTVLQGELAALHLGAVRRPVAIETMDLLQVWTTTIGLLSMKKTAP